MPGNGVPRKTCRGGGFVERCNGDCIEAKTGFPGGRDRGPFHIVIDRRSQGILNFHTLFLAAEAVALWVGMAALSGLIRIYTYYSLLPAWTYWLCIGVGIAVAMSFFERVAVNLVTVGWVGAVRLGIQQVVCVACAIFALAVASKDVGLSRVFVTYYLMIAAVAFTVCNRYQPALLARFFLAKSGRVPMLLMGRAESFPGLAFWLDGQKLLGFEPVGVVSYGGAANAVEGCPVVGTIERLGDAIRDTGAKQVLMLELPRTAEDAEHVLHVCSTHGCRLMMHNNLVVQLERPLRALTHHGYSFLVLHDEPLENPVNRTVKRALDLVIAIPVVLLLLPPLTLAVFVGQSLQSPGKIFFTQVRAGRGGRPFRILKFRSMHEAAGDESAQAKRHDRRVFAFGRWLRRTSMDEIPQFLNVLKSEMSVVGPRPHLLAHDEVFAKSAELYRMRFFVKPGITGLAQAHGFRGEATGPVEIQNRIQMDLTYIRSWSIWLDVAVIGRTIRVVLFPPSSAY